MAAGQIQLVTDLQARARPVADVPVPGDSGWEKAGLTLAKSFHAVGEQIGQMADKAAKGEGEAEGRVAGLDPEFRTRADATLRNEAFNKAGLDIAETRLKTAIDGGIDKLEQQHGASPKALGENVDAMLAGILKNAPDELKPRLQMLGGAKKMVAVRGAERELTARTRADQQAAIQTELTDGFKSLSQMAFKAGLDGDADAVLQARVAALTAATRRTGLDGKPLLDPKAAEKMVQGVQDTVAEARLKGAFDRLETPAAKSDFLRQLDADFKDSKGFAARFDLNGYQSLRRELEGEMRRAESTHSVVNRALAHQIASIREAAERGLPPAPDDLVKLKGAVVGKPELEKDLVEAEHTLKFVSGARRLRPEELDGWIRDETTRLNDAGVRTTGGEVERLKLAEKVLGNVHAEIKQDPLGWAGKVGLVDVAPLDTRSPQAVASSLPTRSAQAEQVAAYYGQEPQYFRPDEKRRLTAAAAGGGKDLLDVVEAVAGAGPARSRRMFAELHDQGASTLALIGGLTEATGRRLPVVLDVADGVAFSRTKEFKGVTEAGGTVRSHQRAIEVHQGALNGQPRQEQALIDATNYAYAIRLQRAHKTDDPDLWKQTFRELMGERKVGGDIYGGVTTYKKQPVVVPVDVKQDKFADLIGALKPTDFPEPPVRGDGSPATMAEIRTARLEAAGEGKYWLNIGSADSPQYLTYQDNPGPENKFKLDLKDVKPELLKRRPDLYLDGRR